MSETRFNQITAEMPVIGFTGALGSGCTYLAEGLAECHNYAYCSLSKPIHEFLKQKGVEQPTSKDLQDAGNSLRAERGLDCLVEASLERVDEQLQQGAKRPVGLIVDGIRNAAEVTALRAWPHFYLVSVQGSQERRKERILRSGNRCTNEEEFNIADARDAQEEKVNGQQVHRCNYLADIIVLNEKEISVDATIARRHFIDSVYNRYVMLIEHLSRGALPRESRARTGEALMTAAYVESKRSSCLKRKAGAIIASPDGNIISAGHNDVPESMEPCIDDQRFGWCARDMLQEKIGQRIEHCPGCGDKIEMKNKCLCGNTFANFVKRCSRCHRDFDIEYTCRKCGIDVFKEFLPGSSPARTGKLLDMCRALHAEENAILSLSRTGIKVPDGTILYCTTFPCNLCANKIVTVGIKAIVYAEPYTMREAEQIFKEKQVKLTRFEGVKSNAYFRMYS